MTRERPITVAILAMGGQGGGVLADWIVDMAERQGWVAQSTSVPGVAQRTGATIYYVEMLPARDGREPVLSLMPTPGDVDVVLAAELMEAGRSMLRGLVTPDRTTLIASTHRALAVSEKERPGDGVADPNTVLEAHQIAAKRAILFDMQALAERNGSVISATLFGALAGAAVLPFSRAAFEAAIAAGGKGVEPSLRAFAAAFAQVGTPTPPLVAIKREPEVPHAAGHPALDALLARIHGEFALSLRPMLFAGVRRLVDYQDPAYAAEYLDRIAGLQDAETDGSTALSLAAAKHLAVAMAYDDVIRVADLKTRASRFARVEQEVGQAEGDVLYMTEFMHPRGEELVASLPAGLGHWIEARPALFRWVDRLVNRGRRVRTGTIAWFMALYLVAALKPRRRSLLRHGREMAHIGSWLTLAMETASRDYKLGVEVINARRLVKGYSDTHARGLSKFDRVLGAVPSLVGRQDSALWMRRLIMAALADEEGKTLDGALRTLASANLPAPVAA